MSKVTKNERISTLERQLAALITLVKMKGYNEVDQRINQIADQLSRQQGVISKLSIMVKEQNEAILMLEKLTDEKLRDQPEPQLKKLDQSVFKEWADCWKFFATDEDGDAWRYREKPKIDNGDNRWSSSNTVPLLIGTGCDASNWQNSLIERDIAKELAEVDLSSELTGSDLAKAMLERGDKYVMCMTDCGVDVIHDLACFVSSTHPYIGRLDNYRAVTPINNQGEPLTASEAGL